MVCILFINIFPCWLDPSLSSLTETTPFICFWSMYDRQSRMSDECWAHVMSDDSSMKSIVLYCNVWLGSQLEASPERYTRLQEFESIPADYKIPKIGWMDKTKVDLRFPPTRFLIFQSFGRFGLVYYATMQPVTTFKATHPHHHRHRHEQLLQFCCIVVLIMTIGIIIIIIISTGTVIVQVSFKTIKVPISWLLPNAWPIQIEYFRSTSTRSLLRPMVGKSKVKVSTLSSYSHWSYPICNTVLSPVQRL